MNNRPRIALGAADAPGQPDAALAFTLEPGDYGTAQTCAACAAMARDAAENDPHTQGLADYIAAQPNPRRALYDDLARRFVFARDPANVERVRTPRLLLDEHAAQGRIVADCDELATLAAALMLAAGRPCAFVTQTRATDPASADFAHIFAAEIFDGASAQRWRAAHPRGGPAPIPGLLPIDPQERTPLGHWPATSRVQWWPV